MNDITTQSVVPAQGDNPARPAINAEAIATFKITDTKLYIPVNYSFNSKVSQIIKATKKKDSKELLSGTNTDQKCLIKIKITV